MRFSFFVTMALLPSAIEIFAAESVAADRIPLCRDGRSAVYLAAASGLDPSVLPAVDDLRRCFEKLTGAALPSERAEGLIPLRLGEAGPLPRSSAAGLRAWRRGVSVEGDARRASI